MKKIVLNTVKMLTLIFFLMTMPFISSFAQEEEENKEEKTENARCGLDLTLDINFLEC